MTETLKLESWLTATHCHIQTDALLRFVGIFTRRYLRAYTL